jgi:hypothetical protein
MPRFSFTIRPMRFADPSFGQHALVQYPGNQNASSVLAVKDHVPAALHPAKTGTNIVTRPAQLGIAGKHLATLFEIVDVTDGLAFAPGTKGISADAEQIGFGATRETKRGHGLARRCREVQCFPHAREYAALGDATGVTAIDGGPQCGEFRFILPLLAIQGPQRRAHYLAGVFVAPALNLQQHEAIKLLG